MQKMVIFKIYMIGIIFLIIQSSVCFPMGLKEIVNVPMKPKKLVIKDGEYLKYSKYESGEKTTDFYLVTRLSQDGKKLFLYREGIELKSDFKLPENYTNYHRKFIISLDDASLIYHQDDFLYQIKSLISNNFKGKIESELLIDKIKERADYKEQIWDGEEIKIRTSRIKIKPDFPILDIDSLGFIGARLFDYSKNGIIYLVAPGAVKEPVPCYFEIKGREVIETKAGRFNTIKVGGESADPFLGKLLENYSKKMFFWIEDSERGLVIKTQDADDKVNILEEISQWKEK